MTEFGKSQLFKYGWTEGKGLGKNENGITKALKSKLKLNTFGFGYSNTEFQRWNLVYNKALSNIIFNKKSNIILKNKNKINTYVLSNGINVEKQFLYYNKSQKSIWHKKNMINDSSNNFLEDSMKNQQVSVEISEDVFKACEGRTGHKSARLGLTLNGKLARITKQEKELHDSTFCKFNNEHLFNKEVKQMIKEKCLRIGCM